MQGHGGHGASWCQSPAVTVQEERETWTSFQGHCMFLFSERKPEDPEEKKTHQEHTERENCEFPAMS